MSEANTTTLSEHLIVRCDEAFLDKADAIADAYDINRSAVVRMLVNQKYRELSDIDADEHEA